LSNMDLILCLTITTAALGIFGPWLSNMWPEAWHVILLGLVLTACATWLTPAKLSASQKKAMLLPLVVKHCECIFEEEHIADADAGPLGDGMQQEENTLVSALARTKSRKS